MISMNKTCFRIPLFTFLSLALLLFIQLYSEPSDANRSRSANQKSSSAQRRGGMSDGGGCLILSPRGEPTLIDLVHTRVQLQKLEQGDQISISKQMLALKTERFEIEKLPSFQLALNIVETQTNPNDIWAIYLKSALSSLHLLSFRATPFYFTKLKEDLCTPIPVLPTGFTVRPAILFTQKTGLLISAPDFNALDLLSQAGLWIHEGIRLMQIIAKIDIPTELLYQMTAELLARHRYGLEKRPLLQGFQLPEEMRLHQKRVTEMAQRLSRVCPFLRSKPEINDINSRYCMGQNTPSISQLHEIENILMSKTTPLLEELSESLKREKATNAQYHTPTVNEPLFMLLMKIRTDFFQLVSPIYQLNSAVVLSLPGVTALSEGLRQVDPLGGMLEILMIEWAVNGNYHMFTSEGRAGVQKKIKEVQDLFDELERDGLISRTAP